MHTRLTEASFVRLSRDDENNGAANKNRLYARKHHPWMYRHSFFFFFFNCRERKRVNAKKRKTVSRANKEDFVTVYLTRSHAYARPRSFVALKRFPSFPVKKKNDPLKGDGRRSGDVPRKGCRRTGCNAVCLTSLFSLHAPDCQGFLVKMAPSD